MGMMNSLIGRLSVEVGEEKRKRLSDESDMREQETRIKE